MPSSYQADFPIALVLAEDRARQEFGDLDGLATSIKEKGVLQPITVNQDGRLLAGERRLRASQMAGLVTIPVIIRDSDKIDSLEVELVENIYRKDLEWQERVKLEKRIYDEKGLNQRETAELTGQSLGIVSTHIQLARALEQFPALGEYKQQGDAWKALKKMEETVVLREILKRQDVKFEALCTTTPGRPFSVYEVAKNHYRIGDAIQAMAEWPNAEVFNFAEVDPPYGIDLGAKKQQLNEADVQGLDRYHEIDMDEYGAFLQAASTQVYRLLAPDSFCVWWFGPSNYELVRSILSQLFDVNEVPAVWHKGNQGQTNHPSILLANCYEMFFVVRKGRPSLAKTARSNVFQYNQVTHSAKIHPTEKPIELLLELYDTFCHPGMRVLCPFLGSGVTLRATYMRNTFGVGWDLEEGNKERFMLKVKEDEDAGRYRQGQSGGGAKTTPSGVAGALPVGVSSSS